MISTFTSPSFVNRVKESWQAGYGVTQTNPVSGGPFTQAGPTLDMNFAAVPQQNSIWVTDQGLTTKTFSEIVTFTRASTATYTDSAGVLQTAAIDAPRFDYNPATLAAQGFFVEETRANVLTYSEDLSNAAWSKGLMTVKPNNLAPDGTNSAYVVNTATEIAALYPSNTATVVSSTTYVVSVYVKAGTATHLRFRFGLGSGSTSIWYSIAARTFSNAGATLTGLSATDAYAGWVRVSVSIAYGASDGGTRSVAVSPTLAAGSSVAGGTVSLWGYQLEAGAFPTSYIPTAAAAATRAADLASANTLSPWFNLSEGTLYSEFDSVASGARTAANISDGTANESIRLRTNSTNPFFTVTDGGVDQADIDAGTVASYTPYKFAGAYKINDFAACIAGGTVQTDTSGTLPTVTQLLLGAGASVNYLNGHLRRIIYYPRRLTNAELQTLTA